MLVGLLEKSNSKVLVGILEIRGLSVVTDHERPCYVGIAMDLAKSLRRMMGPRFRSAATIIYAVYRGSVEGEPK